MAPFSLESFLLLGSDAVSDSLRGCRQTLQSLDPDIVPLFKKIPKLLSSLKEDEIIAALRKAAKYTESGLVSHKSVLFVLACSTQNENLKLRTAAYSLFHELCNTSYELFMFVHFMKLFKMMKHMEKDPKNYIEMKGGISGEGYRNALKKWYGSKTSEELARIIISETSYLGWTHSDIIKLIHFNSPNPEKNAVIQYFLFKKSEAKEKLNEKCKQLALLRESLQKSANPAHTVALLNELNIKLAPGISYAKSPEIWAEYLEKSGKLSTEKILNLLEIFMGSKKFVEKVLPHAIARINDADGASVDPFHVFLALHRYQNCNRQTRKTKAIKKSMGMNNEAAETGEKKKWTPYQADIRVVNALTELLSRSLEALRKEDNKWLLILNLSKGGGDYLGRWHVSVGALAGAISLYAKAAGTSVSVFNAVADDFVDVDCKDYARTVSSLVELQADQKVPADIALSKGIKNKDNPTRIILLQDHGKSKDNGENEALKREFAEYKRSVPDASLLAIFQYGHNSSAIDRDLNLWNVQGWHPKLLAKFTTFSSDKLLSA